MKKILLIGFSVFCINPAFATVYSGTYTSGIDINTQSTIAANTIFNDAPVTVQNILSIEDNVHFLNHTQEPFNGAALYRFGPINIDGDDVLFDNNVFAVSIDGKLNINGNRTHFTNNKSAISTADITYYSEPSNAIGTTIVINGQDTLFNNNSYYTNSQYATQGGGAIFIAMGDILTINGSGTVFSNNTSPNAYGGAIYNYGTVNLNNTVTFNNNSARWGGGAIANHFYYNMYHVNTYHNANLYVAPNTQFINNSVTYGSGGAIYNLANNYYNAYTRIGHDTLFSGNTASANGGAIYNSGKKAVIDIDTGITSVTFATATDSIYNDGGTINFLGTGNINAALTSLTSVQGSSCTECTPVINLGKTSAVFNTVNLSDNTKLKTTVYKDGNTVKSGNISANTFNIQNDNRIKLIVLVENRQTVPLVGAEITVLTDASGSQSTGWDYFGNDTKRPSFALENNLLYDIEFVRDGVYKVTPKPFVNTDPSDTSDIVDNAFLAWNVNGFQSGSIADDIANKLFLLSQSSSTQQAYNQALDTISPNSSGVLESFINHSANSNNLTIQRRQMTDNVGFWGNVDYSSVNYKNNNYSGSVIGGMLGQDVMLLNNLKTGMAFGYNQASITNDVHKFDISQQFNMSLYSKFSLPLNQLWLYADFALNHSQYDITETKNVLDYDIVSEFDAKETSVQFDIGLKRKWFGFDIGARHNSLSLGNYTDSIGQHIDGVVLAYTYATTKAYVSQTLGSFTLGANVGADFLMAGDKQYKNIAVAPNMQRYYYTANLNADTIFSFGANASVALTDRFNIGLVYDGILDGDYSSHTGKFMFNYKI